MAGTTPVMALPYPTDGDLVAQVDEAIQSLAEAVEANLPRGAIDHATLGADSGGIGAATIFTRNLTPGAGRVLRFTVGLDLQGVTAGTGVSVVLKRGGVAIGQTKAIVTNRRGASASR